MREAGASAVVHVVQPVVIGACTGVVSGRQIFQLLSFFFTPVRNPLIVFPFTDSICEWFPPLSHYRVRIREVLKYVYDEILNIV